MKLDELVITNFKGLRSEKLKPTSFACLVGENNAGKSTVLQAIDYALNRPSQLPISLYYDQTAPVEVELHFTEISDGDLRRLSEEHRGRMADVVSDGKFTLVVKWAPGEKVELSTKQMLPKDAKYASENINALLKGKTGAEVRATLIGAFPEYAGIAPATLNITQAKSFLQEQIATLPQAELHLARSPLPTGIPSSITKLLPEPIYIPAVKNLSDDLKSTQSTSFGRLLGLLLDDMAPDLDKIHKTFEELDVFLNRVTVEGQQVDNRHGKVKELEQMVEGFLSENFPAARVELAIPRPELKTILNSAQIYIDDGSKDLVDNKGDGIKRSLTFALLQTYVSRLNLDEVVDDPELPLPQPLIFLFEEPELYLHPKSQRILFRTLAKIAKKYQVLVTTHSPLFFAPGETAMFVRVAKKDAQPKPVGVLHQVEFALDAESAEAFKLARFENADAAFFSRRVVLFEGESDDAFCRHVAALLHADWDFDRQNIAMVRVSGKGNFAKFRKFFEAFGIEVKVIADLDALFDGYAHLGAPATVEQVRSNAIQIIDRRIDELGFSLDPTASKIKDKLGGMSLRERYAAAKEAVAKTQESEKLSPELSECLSQLFEWETIDARAKVCEKDAAARDSLVPLIDELRAHGICVLSKGAIEAYYPSGTPTGGAKPSRALMACGLVESKEVAKALSVPLGPNRPSEFEEIFEAVFK